MAVTTGRARPASGSTAPPRLPGSASTSSGRVAAQGGFVAGWSRPINVGAAVNSGAGETRPSLSWHGEQLLFGRAGPVGTAEGGTGASDIYVTTREKNGKR